jgi:hypothetical protein
MQTPNPFYAGREFGPATGYGLPVTVRRVKSHASGGTFSLPPGGGSLGGRPNPPHAEGEFIPIPEGRGLLRSRRKIL